MVYGEFRPAASSMCFPWSLSTKRHNPQSSGRRNEKEFPEGASIEPLVESVPKRCINTLRNITFTLPSPEGVKKLVRVFFPSVRRKPESSIFEPLRTAWTPVFTGVTTKRKFFHTFPPQGGGNFLIISICIPSSRLGVMGEGRVRGTYFNFFTPSPLEGEGSPAPRRVQDKP